MLKRFIRSFVLFVCLFSVHAVYAQSNNCQLYPITLSNNMVAHGNVFNHVPLGEGYGYFNWLSWSGDSSAKTLANSLKQPGNSEIYINPHNAHDRQLDLGDSVKGLTGVKNSHWLKRNIHALKGKDIVVPLWSSYQKKHRNRPRHHYGFCSAYNYSGHGYSHHGDAYYGGKWSNYSGHGRHGYSKWGYSSRHNGWSRSHSKKKSYKHSNYHYPWKWHHHRSQLNYQIQQFGIIEITGYKHRHGRAYLSFIYKGTTSCNNTAPQAQDSTFETTEDTTLDITVVATDVDGDALTFQIEQSVENGELSGTGPDYQYVPNANFNGSDTFTFKASDGTEESELATVNITVTPVNDAPTVIDLDLQTEEDIDLALTLQGSDTEGEALAYSIVDSPTKGSLTGTAPNLSYKPDANENGTDSFTYRVNDGELNSEIATVTIEITAVNDTPLANAQSLETNEDVPLSITLTGSDIEDDSLTYTLVKTPSLGTISGTIPNLVYTPNADATGEDSISFVVNDGQDDSAEAIVEINILPVNDAPIAADLSLQTDEDTDLAVVLSGSDIEGDAISYTVVDAPTKGTLTGIAPDLTYTPNENENGADSFTYLVNDGEQNSEVATVTFDIAAVNDAPLADEQQLITDEDQTIDIVLAGSDIEDDELTYTVTVDPTLGTISGTAPNLTYTPNTNVNGNDSLSFVVNDGEFDSEEATIEIQIDPVNDAPGAEDQSLNTNEDTSLEIILAGTDLEDDNLMFELVGQPNLGTLSGTAPNLIYTPNADASGSDSFTYKVNDGELDSDLATVNLTIAAVNDAPVGTPDTVTLDEDGSVAITLQGTDIDSSSLDFVVVNNPANGELSGTAPNLTYTPNANYFGADSLSFVVNDGELDSELTQVQITVNPINDAPIITSAPNLVVDISADYQYQLEVADVDDTSFIYELTTAPAGMSIDANGLIIWPQDQFVDGTSNIQIQVEDSGGSIAIQSFDLTLQLIGDITILSNPDLYVGDDELYQYQIETDQDSVLPLSYDLEQFPEGMTVTSSGLIEWSPEASYSNGKQDANNLCMASGSSKKVLDTHAEIVMAVDFSASMTGEILWTKELVVALEAGLLNADVGTAQSNQYGLTKFVNVPTQVPVNGGFFGEMEDYFDPLDTVGISGVRTEDGWSAIDFIINQYPFSEEAARNLILFTDENRDEVATHLTFENLLASLESNNIILNVVVNAQFQCGDGTDAIGVSADGTGYVADGAGGFTICQNVTINESETKEDYVDLALAAGGAAWNIGFFRNGGINASSFARALQEVKINEIINSLPDRKLPDLSVSQLSVDGDRIQVQISNRGLSDSGSVDLVLESSSDSLVWNILSTEFVSNSLSPGELQEVSIAISNVPSSDHLLRARIISADQSPECLTDNNDATLSRVIAVVSAEGGNDVSQEFWLGVNENDQAIAFDVPNTQLATNNAEFRYQVPVLDDKGEGLSYELLTAPFGMKIETFGGLISFVPSENQIGSHPVSVQVTDNQGVSSTLDLVVEVSTDFDSLFGAPQFEEPVSRLVLDQPDGGIYTPDFAIGSQLVKSFELLVGPDTCVLQDDQSGQIACQYSSIESQYQSFFVRLKDELGRSILQQIFFDTRPEITSAPVTERAIEHFYRYDIGASDADGDALNYVVLQGPDGMNICERPYRVCWVPTNVEIGSTHQVEVAVRDEDGFEATQAFTLTITPNSIPVVVSEPSNMVAVGGHTYFTRDIVIQDADNDHIWIELISGPPGLQAGITGASDRGSEPATILWPFLDAEPGDYEVVIGFYDAGNRFGGERFGGEGTYSFTITVVPNNLPVFVTEPPKVAFVGQTYATLDLRATDADNDYIGFQLASGPAGLSVSDHGAISQGSDNAFILWTPTAAQVGNNEVQVLAYDAGNRFGGERYGGETIFTYTINVGDLLAVASTPDGSELETDVQFGTALQVVHRDGLAVTYNPVSVPAGLNIAADGELTWTPVDNQIGQHVITFEAAATDGSSVNVSFTLNVVAPNQPPVINPISNLTIEEDLPFSLQVIASDPEAKLLTYQIDGAPEGISIDANGLISGRPLLGSIGIYSLMLTVTDEKGAEDEVSFEINVVERTSNSAPVFISSPVTGAIIDFEYQYLIEATDQDQDVLTYSLVTGPAGMTLVDDLLSWVPTASDLGDHLVTVGVDDGFGVIEQSWTLSVLADNDAPIVSVNSPIDASLITAPTDLIGSISDFNLSEWRVLIKAANAPSTAFQMIGSGTTEQSGAVLATIDPSLLLNGQYDVVVVATDAVGEESQDSITIAIEGNLKVGNFSFTVEDLNIPLAGLPISVTRTYDSRRKNEALDFGYGWSVGYQDVRTEESRDPGLGWEQISFPSGPLGSLITYCVEPLGAPIVSVTLPTGEVERFEAAASPRCNEVIPILDVELVFNPIGDNQSTLKAVDDSFGRYQNGNIVETGTFTQAINPNRYVLTTKSGYEYQLDQGFGVESITDPNGYTLTFSDAGIVHSSGKSIDFIRDGEGRITQVIDPVGNAIKYSYDANGDLNSVTERDGAVTTHSYFGQNCDDLASATADCHLLDELTDPLGRKMVKNIYDAAGRLIAQEDQNGNRTDFNHDIDGRQSIVTDRNNNTSILFYDDRGNVTSQVDALGNSRSFTYDAQDNQLSQTDELGNISRATYNDRNDQLTQTDELGNTLNYVYNTRGQETELVDARGNQFDNTYDPLGNVLSATDPQGNTAINNINAQGLVSTTFDRLGNSTIFTYDSEGNKLTETDPLGTVTSFTYDDNNNVTTEVRTRTVGGSLVNETTTFVYDSRNRVTQTTDALGNITQTSYDLVGNQASQTDALGRITTMVYDVYGNLLSTTFADTTTETNTYDAENNLLTSTDRLGRIISYQYDALNRQTRITYPDGTFTQTVYDAVGRVTAEIDERGNRTEHEYDAAGRRTAIEDALGNRHTFSYDADDNLIGETDARNNGTSYIYNSLDQRTQTNFADSTTMQEIFDALGRRTQMTDQMGRATGYEYDALGRLTKVTDALNQETTFTYDEQGNKLTQTDAEGRTTSWTYDALGRVLSRALPLGQTETMVYDANGNMISHTDFNGATHARSYDINDRLIRIDYADGASEAFTYDAVGNRLSASITDTNGTRNWAYTYDARDRLLTETKPDGSTLTYAYDNAGNKTSLTVNYLSGSSYTESYSYDELNRLSTVTDRNGNVTTYGYDAVGNRASITNGNATLTSYTYDSLNRLTDLSHVTGLGVGLLSYSYQLDSTGRRTKITEGTGRVTDYVYDDLYRLTSETITDAINGNYSASYQYDKVGNRTQETVQGITTGYTYDNNDRVSQSGGRTYTYDAIGNMLTEAEGGSTTLYNYNSQNELTQREVSGLSIDFQYNPDGIRTSKGGTDYLVDHNRDYAQVLVELDSATSSELVSYTYGDDLLSQSIATQTYFYHYDGLGSARGLTDSAASLTDSYDYEAFGEMLNASGSTDNHYLYAGEQFDADLGQYYLRARYYKPDSGRFTQMDTWMGKVQDPLTLHKYLYSNLDPANMIDPSGNFSIGSVTFSFSIDITGTLSDYATEFVLDNSSNILTSSADDVLLSCLRTNRWGFINNQNDAARTAIMNRCSKWRGDYHKLQSQERRDTIENKLKAVKILIKLHALLPMDTANCITSDSPNSSFYANLLNSIRAPIVLLAYNTANISNLVGSKYALKFAEKTEEFVGVIKQQCD